MDMIMPCISCNNLNEGICIGRCSPSREVMMSHLIKIVPEQLIPKLEGEDDLFVANLYYRATNGSENKNSKEPSP